MKVLIVGSGGREHALAWKIKQSPHIGGVFVTPGNDGMQDVATVLGIADTAKILEWVDADKPDLVLVGADSYLAEGMVDMLEERGVLVFGPTKAAAQIEWSKAYAKQFMKEEGIPTARFEVFTDESAALVYAKEQQYPLVIKASGLALGKGVVIAQNFNEAEGAIADAMNKKVFGEAGSEIVIEEFLIGNEISVHALCDGERAILFPSSQDHKRVREGNTGPNTGGMGTISPVPWVTADDIERIRDTIVLPTLRALKKHGTPFKGLLFPGIMITSDGPKVIEFNARFGDPETESYVRLLDSDLLEALQASARDDLSNTALQCSKKVAATIMLCSGGYPGEYTKGVPISGIEEANKHPDVVVFHSGTKLVEGVYVTNGGRVVGVSATGVDLTEALWKAYAAAARIHFDGMQYRHDIGQVYYTHGG